MTAGCLDFTPLRAAGSADAATAEGSTAASSCLACASEQDDAGGCATEYLQCSGVPLCKATIDCVVNQCFNPMTNIGACLAECEQDGGISSASGPESEAFAAFLQCMSTACEAACLQ